MFGNSSKFNAYLLAALIFAKFMAARNDGPAKNDGPMNGQANQLGDTFIDFEIGLPIFQFSQSAGVYLQFAFGVYLLICLDWFFQNRFHYNKKVFDDLYEKPLWLCAIKFFIYSFFFCNPLPTRKKPSQSEQDLSQTLI